jgi:hypothetical protein
MYQRCISNLCNVDDTTPTNNFPRLSVSSEIQPQSVYETGIQPSENAFNLVHFWYKSKPTIGLEPTTWPLRRACSTSWATSATLWARIDINSDIISSLVLSVSNSSVSHHTRYTPGTYTAWSGIYQATDGGGYDDAHRWNRNLPQGPVSLCNTLILQCGRTRKVTISSIVKTD